MIGSLVAVALVMVEATIGSVAGEKAIDGRTFAALLRSVETLRAASEELGDVIAPDDVSTSAEGDRVRFKVQGEGRQSALARCHALIRATERRVATDQGRSAEMKFLRDEWRATRREHEQLTTALSSDAVARAEAKITALRQAKLGACTNEPPLPRELAPIATECAAAKRELEQLLTRYGEKHPRVIEQQVKLVRFERRFEDERQTALVSPNVIALLAKQSPAQKAKLRWRADQLASTLILLGDRLAAIDPEIVVSRLLILDGCH